MPKPLHVRWRRLTLWLRRRLGGRAAQSTVDVLESMNDAFFSVDKDWIFTGVNRHLIRVAKKSRAELIGHNFLEIFFSDGQAQESQYLIQYGRVMRERVPVSFEDYYPPLKLWTSIDAYPTANGGMAVFFRDVTDQKSAARRVDAETHKFEAIFVDSPASMALLRGPDFIFEKVNPKYTQLMGHRQLVGKNLHEALPELIGQPFHRLMQEVFATGVPYRAREMMARLVRQPGGEPEEGYFDFTYTRVADGDGKPYGLYIHAVEITDRVRARQDLEQSEQRLKKLAQDLQVALATRDEFLSIASHELKTPVTSLKMQLQLTRRSVNVAQQKVPSAERLARVLDIANRQIDRLTALIEELLDIARIGSGKMSYAFERLDLGALVEEVVERFAEQFVAAHCPLTQALAAQVWVYGDRFRLEQVVQNLLSNALKYGAGAPIHIDVEPCARGGRLRVVDRGIGIAEDKQSQIFGCFERAVSHHNISGLGLGLYICQQIVDAHRGRIAVKSVLGQGSNFAVELPAAPPA